MEERSNRFRQKMATPRLNPSGPPALEIEALNLDVLKMTPQIHGIFTILRSVDTSRQDFIFFVDRLSTILVEYAMKYLPYDGKTVMTPVGSLCHGKVQDAEVRLVFCNFWYFTDKQFTVRLWCMRTTIVSSSCQLYSPRG